MESLGDDDCITDRQAGSSRDREQPITKRKLCQKTLKSCSRFLQAFRWILQDHILRHVLCCEKCTANKARRKTIDGEQVKDAADEHELSTATTMSRGLSAQLHSTPHVPTPASMSADVRDTWATCAGCRVQRCHVTALRTSSRSPMLALKSPGLSLSFARKRSSSVSFGSSFVASAGVAAAGCEAAAG